MKYFFCITILISSLASVSTLHALTCMIPHTQGIEYVLPGKSAGIWFSGYFVELIEETATVGEYRQNASIFEKNIPIPETDTLMNALTEKLFGEKTQNTMTLTNQLFFEFHHHPLHQKIYILGAYDRWKSSQYASKGRNPDTHLLKGVSNSVAYPETYDPNYQGYEQICDFQDKNPLSYNSHHSISYKITVRDGESQNIQIFPFDVNAVYPLGMWNFSSAHENPILIADPILDIAQGEIRIFSLYGEEILHSSQSEWTRKYHAGKYQKNSTGIFPYYEMEKPYLPSGSYRVEFSYYSYTPNIRKDIYYNSISGITQSLE